MTPAEAAIIEDVARNPGTSVTEIAHRIGFVQSHVSTSVARLRERGVVGTTPDATDRRRTNVQVSRPAMRAIVRRARRPINDTIAAVVGDAATAQRVADMLDELADLLLAPAGTSQHSTSEE
jgi:DNA-binding MarR family transcriptional regulator